MKKESIISILIYLFVFAAAIIYGFTVLQTHFQNSQFNQSVLTYALYILVSVASGIIVAGLLQEFGHFLGAKTGGYKILSWCVFYFTFYKDKEKTKFKFAGYDGLTGQTKIVPDFEKKDRPNPYPYLLYGSFFTLSWIAVCLILFFRHQAEEKIMGDMAYYFLTMGVIAFLVFVYNIVPAKVDSLTDGYRLTQIKKDVEGFNQLLLAENGGTLPGESNGESTQLEPKKPAKYIPEVALNEVYPLLVEHKYDEVFTKLDEVLEHADEMTNKSILEAKAQYLYAYMFAKTNLEIDEYYDKEVPFAFRRELANSGSLPVIRTYLLTAGILDNSQSEVLLTLKKVVKAYKNVPANRKHDELVLFNEALDKVSETHPKWEEIQNYKLFE